MTMGGAKHEDLTLDFGLRPPNSLGDLVWSDVNRNGVQHTLPVPLSHGEAEALRRSAATVRTIIRRLGL